jgi:hypothetical protein
MSYQPTDPVEAVGGVSSASKATSMHVGGPEAVPKSSKSGDMMNVNYIFLVMQYTNKAMQNQSNVVAMRAQMEGIVTKMQSDLATISSFISKIQSESHAGGFFDSETRGGDTDFFDMSPSALSGLNSQFYSLQDSQGADFGTDNNTVSTEYQNSMQGFVSAVKDLYYCSSSGSGATVKDISKITNPYGGKDFDLTGGFWSKIQGEYSKYTMQGKSIISTNPTDHPSLMQQYMYYQTQLSINTASQQDVTDAAASGDLSKLVNFDPNTTGGGLDSNIGPMLQLLDSLNTTVSADRDYANVGNNWGVHASATVSTSRNILSMILTGDNGDLYTSSAGHSDRGTGYQMDSGADCWDGYANEQVGLYGAFSYMAMNYLATKNPSTPGDSWQGCNYAPGFSANGWPFHFVTGRSGIMSKGDPLSSVYSNTNTAQTNLSASANTAGTEFQQSTAAVQTTQQAAGKMIDSFTQSQANAIQNFKS